MKPNYLRQVFGFKVLVPILWVGKQAFSRIDRERDRANLFVNVGGGTFVKRHWRNLDYISPSYPYRTTIIDDNFDLTSGESFPYADSSVKFFYSSHTLEHLPQRFCGSIFREFYRCLMPGGSVRLTMPDYDYIYESYRQGRTDFWGPNPHPNAEQALCWAIASDLYNKINTNAVREMARSLSREKLGDRLTGMVTWESQRANAGNHCNWWNFDKLRRCLAEAGFKQIYRSEAFASRFPELRDPGSFLGIEKFAGMPGIRGFDVKVPDRSVFSEAIK